MTGRDRLVELLEEATHHRVKVREGFTPEEHRRAVCEMVADVLLASGAVIVPPVKLGDVVYIPAGGPKNKRCAIYEKQVIGLHIIGEDLRIRRKNRVIESYVILRAEFGDVYHVPMAKLGKTFFLTKEDAVRAAQQTTKGEDGNGKDENPRETP